jgi:hypothetical protein
VFGLKLGTIFDSSGSRLQFGHSIRKYVYVRAGSLSHHDFGETMQLKGFEKVRDLRCERESKTSELNKTECLVRLAISLKRRKKKVFFFFL